MTVDPVLTYLRDAGGEQQEGESGDDGAGQHGQRDDEVEDQPQNFEDLSEHVTIVLRVALRYLEGVIRSPAAHSTSICRI